MGRIWEGNGKFDCHFIDLAMTGQIDTRECIAMICNVVALYSPCVFLPSNPSSPACPIKSLFCLNSQNQNVKDHSLPVSLSLPCKMGRIRKEQALKGHRHGNSRKTQRQLRMTFLRCCSATANSTHPPLVLLEKPWGNLIAGIARKKMPDAFATHDGCTV